MPCDLLSGGFPCLEGARRMPGYARERMHYAYSGPPVGSRRGRGEAPNARVGRDRPKDRMALRALHGVAFGGAGRAGRFLPPSGRTPPQIPSVGRPAGRGLPARPAETRHRVSGPS